MPSINSRVTKTIVANQMFEIEKKFKPGEGFESRLLEYGGIYMKKVNFIDTYYDSEDHLLTLSDYWLRWRERIDSQQWELKVPLPERYQGTIKVDKYKEIADELEIVKQLALHPHVQGSVLEGKKTVKEAMVALGVKAIATFETFRTKYKVPGGFIIDLDKSSFGYHLGEIEVVCQSKEEVNDATERILDLGKKLGESANINIGGNRFRI